jgi:hypothetical protein
MPAANGTSSLARKSHKPKPLGKRLGGQLDLNEEETRFSNVSRFFETAGQVPSIICSNFL